MRVTNNLMSNSVVESLQRNVEQLQNIQNTIATGKQVRKPSDGPVQMANILELRKKISSIEQYGQNIQWGRSWLNTTDAALQSIDTLLVRAKELAVYQSTETATDATRDMAAEEVKNVYDQMIQLGNTRLGGRYLFAGYQTDTAPFSRDGSYSATYAGDTGTIGIIVGENVEMEVNSDGTEVFDNGVDIFEVMKNLKEGLENNDTAAISARIEELDAALNQVLNERAQVGARLNRLEASQNHWQVFKLNTQEMLNNVEDADLMLAMTKLQGMEVAYEAALSATASIIQPNLMQFMR